MLTSHKIQNEPAISLAGASNKGQALPLNDDTESKGVNFFAEAFNGVLAEQSVATDKLSGHDGNIVQAFQTPLNSSSFASLNNKSSESSLLAEHSILSKLNDAVSVDNMPTEILSSDMMAIESPETVSPDSLTAQESLSNLSTEFDVLETVKNQISSSSIKPNTTFNVESFESTNPYIKDAVDQNNIIESNVIESNVIESNVIESNVIESKEALENAFPFGYQAGNVIDKETSEDMNVSSLDKTKTANTDSLADETISDENLSLFKTNEEMNKASDDVDSFLASQLEEGVINSVSHQVELDKLNAEHLVNNQQVQEELASINNAAALNQANSANTAVSGNPASVDKPVNNINAQSASLNQQTSWGAQSAEAGQAANSGNQNSASSQSFAGNQQSQMAQQMMTQQQEQKSQALNQQAALKMGDELAAKSESKEFSLTGDLGATGERRQALPIGLQAINVPVKSPQWGQAVAHRVSFMANNQIQQAHITLNPEKLGPIQIKLQIDRDQQVQVSMLATHTTTREALENAMPRLREMLEQSGMNLVSVDISDEKQFAEQQSEQSQTSSSASQLGESSEQSDEAMVAVKSVETDNIVDYYA